ncbi:peptidoglycan bridge formation glycyltransferase FemA/FemB family protein [Candidatus Gottesmanbacteria bacterium]|nr:peptidoglycan bridge formation glycyltransferase FemA/FemB family protein [Candidatus Gottesmanbacteria bacterium]
MTIREITDREEWERFWESHAPGALFQSWLWGEVVKKQLLPLTRFGLYDGSKLIGIFQVVTVRARRGIYLHVRQGPIVSPSIQRWSRVTDFLRDQAKREGASFIRVSPPVADLVQHRKFLQTLGLLPAATHEVDAERCWVLDITPGEEAILAGMRKTTRYEIRHAQHLGVRIVTTTAPIDLDKFFVLYGETAKRHHFVEHRGIREEFDVFVKEGKAVLLLGYYQQTLLSAAIILFLADQAIYHHSASVPTDYSVNYAIQWEAIREAKRRGMKVYNFWGIAPLDAANHPWHGITVFKTGFGGREVQTIHAHDLPVSPRYWPTRAIEWWERTRKGY